MSDRVCPNCQRGTLRRSERRGFWERTVLPLFHRYPWRCTFCKTRLTLDDRGPKRQYVQPHHTVGDSGDHSI